MRDQGAGEGLREAGVEHRKQPAEARVDGLDLDRVEQHAQPADDRLGDHERRRRSTRACAATPLLGPPEPDGEDDRERPSSCPRSAGGSARRTSTGS